MHTPSFRHTACLLATFTLALCAVAVSADSRDFYAESGRIVLAQASETTLPTDAATVEQGHDTPAVTPALPNLNPHINKKRVAFWGVTFMAATSVAFVIFGVWAMRKAPKPGQQRPG